MNRNPYVRVTLGARSACPCGYIADSEELAIINQAEHFVDFDRTCMKEQHPCLGCGAKTVVKAVWMESRYGNGRKSGWFPFDCVIVADKVN